MIAAAWVELSRVAGNLAIVLGIVSGVVLLAFVVTRESVESFLSRWASMLTGAGLLLGSIFTAALASQRTNGSPSLYNALIWISAACLVAVVWMGIRAHLPRRLKEAERLSAEEEATVTSPTQIH